MIRLPNINLLTSEWKDTHMYRRGGGIFGVHMHRNTAARSRRRKTAQGRLQMLLLRAPSAVSRRRGATCGRRRRHSGHTRATCGRRRPRRAQQVASRDREGAARLGGGDSRSLSVCPMLCADRKRRGGCVRRALCGAGGRTGWAPQKRWGLGECVDGRARGVRCGLISSDALRCFALLPWPA